MAHGHRLLLPRRLDQFDHVADQVQLRVALDLQGSVRAAITAHVRRYSAVACGRQRCELMTP